MTERHLVGLHVRNPGDHDLGVVENVSVDVDTGTVTSVAVSLGGLLGLGSRHFDLPWDEFVYDPDGGVLRLDISRGELEAARSMKTDPDERFQTWRDEVTRAYLEHPPPM